MFLEQASCLGEKRYRFCNGAGRYSFAPQKPTHNQGQNETNHQKRAGGHQRGADGVAVCQVAPRTNRPIRSRSKL